MRTRSRSRNRSKRLIGKATADQPRYWFAERLEDRVLLAAIAGVEPPSYSHNASREVNPAVVFDGPVDAGTVDTESFVVHAMSTGQLGPSSGITVTGLNAHVDPIVNFFPGELVQATITARVQDLAGEAVRPYTWQFRTAAASGSGVFGQGQQLGDQPTLALAVGDLDLDGDLDAFIGNRGAANRVWINQGGRFTDSGQALGNHQTFGVALGDLDGDGDLDAFVTNTDTGHRIWLNEAGTFTDSGQDLTNSFGRGRVSVDVALGDLDGDGDLDAFVTNVLDGNVVWLNDGGRFTEAAAYLGTASSNAVELGDFDGDGDLDAFVANSYQPNRVWINDSGSWADSGQSLGFASSRDVAVGDLDGDGDADAFVVNSNQPNRIWLNDGGTFVDSGQQLGDHASFAVSLGDVDADGDLDAFVANADGANRVWLNEGGIFTDSSQRLTSAGSYAVAVGDMDGDGDLDAFVGSLLENQVWENLNASISILPPSLILPEGQSGVTRFDFVVTRAIHTTGPVSVDYELRLLDSSSAQVDDFVNGTVFSGTLQFAAGITEQAISVGVVGDTVVENDERFALTLSNPQGGGATIFLGTAEATIRNDDGADLGDLPLPFPTAFADNGPAHLASGPMLGTQRDVDSDGQPSAEANGDDLTGDDDDEDGVSFAGVLAAGQLGAAVVVNASGPALLDAWIDFDGDRSFGGPLEQIFASQPVTAGDNLLHFSVPAAARQGSTFARFRLSTAGGLPPTGGAADGEVEDHRVMISNPGGAAIFGDSQQSLGDHRSLGVALGDLDGDGDLDAVIANGNQEGNRIWRNEGGSFSDSGQVLGDHSSADVALGDLDRDGDLDAFFANAAGSRVWLNDDGVFIGGEQPLGDESAAAVALGDLDGDGSLDAFVTLEDAGSRVWLNNGDGSFRPNGQRLGDHAGRGVALGDLDGDGDLDAFVTNYLQADRIWWNQGGRFSDSGQLLGDHRGWGVALGDLDGDDDLDAFTTNVDQVARLWLNQGGRFTDSGQQLDGGFGLGVALGDLNGDGQLDVMIASGDIGNAPAANSGNRVFLNQGGVLTEFEQPLGNQLSFDVALGDLDGDGDLDAFTANYYQPGDLFPVSGQANRVWLNLENETLLSVAPVEVVRSEANAGQTAFEFTVTRVGNLTQPGSVEYTVAGLGRAPRAAGGDDFGGSLPAGTVHFAAGQSSQTITVDVSGDTQVELDESFSVTLTDPQPAESQILRATATGRITNDDLLPLTVFLDVDNTSIRENLGAATFRAILSSAAGVDVTVDLAITGTATRDEDYTVSASQIVIPAGEISGEITVSALVDAIEEEPETVIVEIAGATNATVGLVQQTTTIDDDDAPPETLFVTSVLPLNSGFLARFSLPFSTAPLNLYSAERGTSGPADVTLVGERTGSVTGTVVLDESRTALTFVKTGGFLEPDIYTATFRSGSSGFITDDGALLDGNADGITGDDNHSRFTVEHPEDAVFVSIPDVVRGPGQVINIPADSQLGLPLMVTTPTPLSNFSVSIEMDDTIIDLRSVPIAVGPDAPPGSSVNLFFSFNRANVQFRGTIPAGTSIIAVITASVVNDPALHNRTQAVGITGTARQGGRSVFVVGDNAIIAASYFGDVSGNGRINASDAARVARVAALLDSGFADAPLVDPRLLGDVSGNGRINSADASLLAQAASLIPVPQIPAIPAAALATALGGFAGQDETRPATATQYGVAAAPPLFRPIDPPADAAWAGVAARAADRGLLAYLHDTTDGDPDEESLLAVDPLQSPTELGRS